jgi:tetratricopeptide (TPR) repeat protein
MKCPYCNKWGIKFFLRINEHNMCRFCKKRNLKEYNFIFHDIKSYCTKINFTYNINDIRKYVITLTEIINHLKLKFIYNGYKINFNLELLNQDMLRIKDISFEQEFFLLKRLEIIKSSHSLINTNVIFSQTEENFNLLEEKHKSYLFLIDYYYKMRKQSNENIDKTVQYCNLDIQLIESKFNEMEFIINKSYNIRSFTQLIIIYSSRKQFDYAIEICDKALKLKIPQTKVKYGYYGRKIKLLKLKAKELVQ